MDVCKVLNCIYCSPCTETWESFRAKERSK